MGPYTGAVVGLHGFTQSRASWGPFGDLLAAAYPWRPLDLPGHGAGGPPCSVPEAAAGVARQLDGARCVVGYSLGARVALELAIEHPLELDRLVLISGTAGIEDPRERSARRAADEALADTIAEDGLEAFLGRWLAQPMFSGLEGLPYATEGRSGNDPEGIAGSLRLAGTGTMTPLWDRLGELVPELLVVVGERDEKFTAIGQRLVAVAPRARIAVVRDAGHAVHLEAPEATAHAVLGFLAG